MCVCGLRSGVGVFWGQEVKYSKTQHAFCLSTGKKSELYIVSVWQQSKMDLFISPPQMSLLLAVVILSPG